MRYTSLGGWREGGRRVDWGDGKLGRAGWWMNLAKKGDGIGVWQIGSISTPILSRLALR